MVTHENFSVLLESLGFMKIRSTYTKTIGPTLLAVDVAKQSIHYPESAGLIVNER